MSEGIFGGIVHAYTRTEALADGFMHDITGLAREYGFIYPVHVAQNAWAEAISLPHDNPNQDETSRAWDVLTMAQLAVRAEVRRGNRTVGPIRFTVVRITEPDRHEMEPITLEIELGPGDKGEPVFTITAEPDR